MTKFEAAAKKMEREHGKPRPSFDHTIETYTEREEETANWISTMVFVTVLLAGAILVFDYFGGPEWLLNSL